MIKRPGISIETFILSESFRVDEDFEHKESPIVQTENK
jgi:hypothetical protein